MSYAPLYETEFFDSSISYISPSLQPPPNHFNFYNPPPPPQSSNLEPVVPHGWRTDWSRSSQDWYNGTIHGTSITLQPTSAVNSNLHPIRGDTMHIQQHQHQQQQQQQQQHPQHGFQNIRPPIYSDISHCERKSNNTVYKPIPRESITQKPFRCQTCAKSFSQAANLTAHRRVHTGEKPFTCNLCHRPFSQSSSLVTHKRTHTGERPYPCPRCEKAFTDSSTLTKHLRTHTGAKPYECSLCPMKFTQSGNLHRHMKTHKSSNI